MTATPIRTILVDDHPVVVAGARALIEASPDIVCVGEANTGAAAMDLIRELQPDVIILDVSLPDTNGLVLARRIIEEGHQARIVMMTLHEERSYIQQALQIGAKGFVLKRSAGENLLQAIRSVMLGGLYLDPGTAKSMVGPATAPRPARSPPGRSRPTSPAAKWTSCAWSRSAIRTRRSPRS